MDSSWARHSWPRSLVLVAAGMTTTTSLPAVKDLPLAHAFRQNIAVASGKPWIATLPSNVGFVITLANFPGYEHWEIEINGQLVNIGFDSWFEGVNATTNALRNPPRIVPPGGTLKIVRRSGSSASWCELGGYFISAADLGG